MAVRRYRRIGPESSLRLAGAFQRDSQIILQLMVGQESLSFALCIHIVPRLSFASTEKFDSWSNYQLNLKNGSDLDHSSLALTYERKHMFCWRTSLVYRIGFVGHLFFKCDEIR